MGQGFAGIQEEKNAVTQKKREEGEKPGNTGVLR